MCVALGCSPAVDQLYAFSRWITPPHMRFRYDTNFYVCELQRSVAQTDSKPCWRREAARIDEQEVVELEWLTPLEALRRYANHDLQLSPPTWVTLCQLSVYPKLDPLLAKLRCRSSSLAPRLQPYQPKFQSQEDGTVVMRLREKQELTMNQGHFSYRDGDRVIHSSQFATAKL
mmetsp:Transcript_5604/g.14189  ORF Transcript_5604/g.14189 Transcript_5604/m.14189 type:complete len:173 (-) Transcript_5604:95-613(-)